LEINFHSEQVYLWIWYESCAWWIGLCHG